MAVHLSAVYSDPDHSDWFVANFQSDRQEARHGKELCPI